MDKSGVAAAQFGGIRAVTRYQWLVFLVVWLGWTLDAADFGLYSLVLKPAMTELLGGNPPLADIGKYGGLLSMAGLLGWAFGGFLFGILADYIGRVRTLAFSIALYSVFTALQGLSQGIFDFAIYRFIAGLGTGAELMVGIPLLAETLAETHRAKIAATMMTGGALGTFIGAWAYGLVGPYGWRYVFLSASCRRSFWRSCAAGCSTRSASPMSGSADAPSPRACEAKPPTASSCVLRHCSCSPGSTATTPWSGYCSTSARCSIWTTNIWLPTILSLMAQKSGAADTAAAVPFVSHGIMLWSLGGICGYIAFGFICDIIGRRLTVILYSAGTIVFGLILYLALPAYEPWYPVVLPIFGFFVFGVFSGYAVYLPELFPTHIRSTAVGFCTGSARIITSFGPLVAGLLVGAFGGSFNRVTAFMTCFALLSILAMLLGRETKGNPLPR